MSIHPVVADAPTWLREEWLLLIVIPVALLVAWWAGAFRRRSVIGPERFDPRDGSPGVLWVIALIGFGTWMLVPMLYINLTHGDELRQRAATQVNSDDDSVTTQPAAFVLPPRETVSLGAASQLVALVVLLVADSRLLRPGGLARLGLSPSKLGRGVAMGVAGILVAAPLTWVSTLVVQFVWARLGLPSPKDHELIRMLREAPPVDLKLIVTASATLCAPMFEEILFRGHVQTAVVAWLTGLARTHEPKIEPPSAEPAWPRWGGIALAALTFAMVHETGWMIPPLFVLAVCFGYAYERTGNLWAPIAMHALFNALNISMVLFGR